MQLAGADKLEITSTGVDVTGTVTTDGLTVDGTSTLRNVTVGVDGTYGGNYRTIGFSGNTNGSTRIFGTTDNSDNLYLAAGTGRGINFWVNGSSATVMQVDSSGNVGIGITTPDAEPRLHVWRGDAGGVASATNSVLTLENNTTAILQFLTPNNANQQIRFGDPQDTGAGFIQYNHTDNAIQFGTNGPEKMRIDSSGNLLVGKTTLDYEGTAGLILRGDGLINATRSGGNVTDFNRLSTDGEVVRISKDGTTVGSISAYAGSIIAGSGDTGIFFYDGGDVLRPVSPTTLSTRDNAIDIGSSAARWKDLYLSGGVYLGGTGSANYLDDYEEGTWDPTLLAITGSFGSITYDAFTKGAYTRIGRVVYITGTIRTDAITVGTAGTGVSVSGLPFTVASNNPTTSRNMLSPLALSDQTSFANDSPNRAEFSSNGTTFILQKQSSIASDIALLLPSDLGTGANANRLCFSGFYFTDA
jgi:hypothetical protein